MKIYKLLEKPTTKNYVIRAIKYIFSVTPALMISLIFITVVNGLAATVIRFSIYNRDSGVNGIDNDFLSNSDIFGRSAKNPYNTENQ